MIATVAAPPAATADLILLRMAVGAKPPGAAMVRKDIGTLLYGRSLTETEFGSLRDELQAGGYLSVPRKGSIALTDTGRARAMAFADVAELPPRSTWGTVKSKLLLPHAIGLSSSAAGKLNSGDKLAALLLARKYDLPFTAGSTLKPILEALTCRELGHSEVVSLEGLLCHVLSKFLQSSDTLSREDLEAQLPLYDTGLKDAKTDTVRTALLRQWLFAPRWEPPEVEPPAEFDLVLFANTVQALARVSPPSDRFHDNKVYIASIWRASQREHGFPRMTLAEFKERLLAASAAGLLTLSRADLVQEMPASLVAESETGYLNATFHFVLLEENRP